MEVKNIDEFDMKKLLKECPKPIQDYVKSLNKFIDNSSVLRDKQTRIIREQGLEIENLLSALKDNHNLLIEAVKNNYQSHHITRLSSNEYIFIKHEKHN